MAAPRSDRSGDDPLVWLARGDWPWIVALLDSPRRFLLPPEIVGLVGQCVVVMWLRACGRVVDAGRVLDRAISRLPEAYRAGGPGAWRVVVAALPGEPNEVERAVWTLSRILFREQRELDELVARCGRTGATARTVLVLAVVQQLVTVDCVPYLHTSGRGLTGVPFDLAPVPLLGRASELRRLVNPLHGDMTRSVWDRAEGLRGLRPAALRQLCQVERDGSDASRRITGIPLKDGYLVAVRHAQAWVDATG